MEEKLVIKFITILFLCFSSILIHTKINTHSPFYQYFFHNCRADNAFDCIVKISLSILWDIVRNCAVNEFYYLTKTIQVIPYYQFLLCFITISSHNIWIYFFVLLDCADHTFWSSTLWYQNHHRIYRGMLINYDSTDTIFLCVNFCTTRHTHIFFITYIFFILSPIEYNSSNDSMC